MSAPMGKKGTKVKKGHTKEERKQERKQLGTLKSLTVQPKTKVRYQESLNAFFQFLNNEGLELPTKRSAMDDLISDYLEHLWAEGEGRACASTFMAALQDFDPKLKGNLASSWRLMRTWVANEIPARAPPLTESILRAMVGWAIFHEHYSFGLSVMVAFHGLLRTGELLALQAWQIHMVGPSSPAVVSLGLTKTGKRQGAAESVTLTDHLLLKFLWEWKRIAHAHDFLTPKPHVWRDLFSQCMTGLRLEDRMFRPYSLRRGGATHLFVQLGSFDRILILGRWTALKSAKIYLNSGLAMLAELQISPQLLKPFHTVFANFFRSTPKLEPARKSSRTGARGKKEVKQKRRQK